MEFTRFLSFPCEGGGSSASSAGIGLAFCVPLVSSVEAAAMRLRRREPALSAGHCTQERVLSGSIPGKHLRRGRSTSTQRPRRLTGERRFCENDERNAFETR